MTTFNDREKEFEEKFKHDEEFRFKTTMRRNKLLGLWVAEQLGITGEGADAYAREVIESDFQEPGDEDVFRKVWGDLQAKNVDISKHLLRKQMDELMAVAQSQMMEKLPKD